MPNLTTAPSPSGVNRPRSDSVSSSSDKPDKTHQSGMTRSMVDLHNNSTEYPLNESKDKPATVSLQGVLTRRPVPDVVKDHAASRQFHALTGTLNTLVTAGESINTDITAAARGKGWLERLSGFFRGNTINNTELRQKAEVYSEKTKALQNEINRLNEMSRNLHYSYSEVTKQLSVVRNAATVWNRQLDDVMTLISLAGTENSTSNMHGNVLQAAQKYKQDIEPLLNEITTHTKELKGLRDHAEGYQKKLLSSYDAKKHNMSEQQRSLNNNELLWLHDLHEQINNKKLSSPFTAPGLSSALSALMEQGVIFPPASETIDLLERFFPLEKGPEASYPFFPGKDSRWDSPLTAEQQKDLKQRSPKTLDEYKSKDGYVWEQILTKEQLSQLNAADTAAINAYKKQDQVFSDRTRYLNIFQEAVNDPQSLSFLREEAAALQQQREEHPAYKDLLSVLMNISRYYEVAAKGSGIDINLKKSKENNELSNNDVLFNEGNLRVGHSAIASSATVVNQVLMRQFAIHGEKNQLPFNDNWAHELLEPLTKDTTPGNNVVKTSATLCLEERNLLKKEIYIKEATPEQVFSAALNDDQTSKAAFFQSVEKRTDLLKKYETALADLSASLPVPTETSLKTQKPPLAAHLKIELQQVRNEITLLEALLSSNEKLKQQDNKLSLLQQASKGQSTLSEKLHDEMAAHNRKMATTLADTNVKFYQARSEILQGTIDATRKVALALAEKPVPNAQQLVRIYANTLEQVYKKNAGADKWPPEKKIEKLIEINGLNDPAINGPLKKDDGLVMYNRWMRSQESNQQELAKLHRIFSTELLVLGKEIERAGKHGGYPEDIDFTNLVKSKFNPRTSTHSFLLSYQLAREGKTLVDAYQDLYHNILSPVMKEIPKTIQAPFTTAFKDLPDIDSTALSLYKTMSTMKPADLKKQTGAFAGELKKFIEWTVYYPEQAEKLVGDLAHFYNSMMRLSFGMGSDITNMINGVVTNSSLQEQAHQLLSGDYKNVAGITPDAPPLSSEMIAFLHLSSLMPYAMEGFLAASDYNLSGRLTGLGLWGASFLSTPIDALTRLPGAALLIKGMFGVAQAAVENELVKKLRNNQKELEAARAINAVLSSDNAHVTAFNAFMKFYTQVQATKISGTLLRDAVEGHNTRLGKVGNMLKRQGQRVKSSFKVASPRHKAAMGVTGAGIAAVGVGGGITATVLTGGAAPVVIGVGVSIIAVPLVLDRMLPKKLHNEYIMKMTNKRIDDAIDRLLDPSVDQTVREEVTNKLNEFRDSLNHVMKQGAKVTKAEAKKIIKAHVEKFLNETLPLCMDSMKSAEIQRLVSNAIDNESIQAATTDYVASMLASSSDIISLRPALKSINTRIE